MDCLLFLRAAVLLVTVKCLSPTTAYLYSLSMTVSSSKIGQPLWVYLTSLGRKWQSKTYEGERIDKYNTVKNVNFTASVPLLPDCQACIRLRKFLTCSLFLWTGIHLFCGLPVRARATTSVWGCWHSTSKWAYKCDCFRVPPVQQIVWAHTSLPTQPVDLWMWLYSVEELQCIWKASSSCSIMLDLLAFKVACGNTLIIQ